MIMRLGDHMKEFMLQPMETVCKEYNYMLHISKKVLLKLGNPKSL